MSLSSPLIDLIHILTIPPSYNINFNSRQFPLLPTRPPHPTTPLPIPLQPTSPPIPILPPSSSTNLHLLPPAAAAATLHRNSPRHRHGRLLLRRRRRLLPRLPAAYSNHNPLVILALPLPFLARTKQPLRVRLPPLLPTLLGRQQQQQ